LKEIKHYFFSTIGNTLIGLFWNSIVSMGVFSHALVFGLALVLSALVFGPEPNTHNPVVKAVNEQFIAPPNCTLRYFNVRGRAEPIRQMLELVGWPYTQELFTSEQWRAGGIKEKGMEEGLFTFGQVPQLSIQFPSGKQVRKFFSL
jgi:hypothetical protein